MALPHFEVPTGDINGLNRIFRTALPYLAGSTAVFVNGQLKRKDYNDGWVETNPSSGAVTLDQAPLVGDVVQIFYIDTLPVQVGIEVTPLYGSINAMDDLEGVVLECDSLSGTISGL